MSNLLGLGNLDHTWAGEHSQEMARMLELPDPEREQNWNEPIRENFTRFHRNWLRYCIREQDFDHIGEILSAIQGRNLAQELLDEIDLAESGNDAPGDLARLRELRRLLREKLRAVKQLNQRTAAGTYNGSRSAAGNDNPEVIQAWHAQAKMLTREFHEYRTEYQALLCKLAKDPRYHGLIAAYQPISKEQLAAHLKPGQVLLVLIDLRLQAVPSDGRVYEALQGAWLIPRSGPSRWCDLSALDLDLAREAIQVCAHAIQETKSRTFAWRRDATQVQAESHLMDLDMIDPAHFWPQLARKLEETLWQPIESAFATALQHLDTFVVVTHGRFHQLPLTLGRSCPANLTRHSALIFWIKSGDVLDTVEPVCGFLPYQDTDLDLAPHEGSKFLAPVWRNCGREVRLFRDLPTTGSWQQMAFFHFAGHGQARSEQPEASSLGVTKEKWLTFTDILRSRVCARYVFLSACLAGNTYEDRNGDPLGILPAFFMRGTRIAVGCLTQVDDLWITLLSMLTAHAEAVQSLSLDRALAEAKQHLSDWTSYPDYRELLPVYQEALAEFFEQKEGIFSRFEALMQETDADEREYQREYLYQYAQENHCHELITALARPDFPGGVDEARQAARILVLAKVEHHLIPPLQVCDFLSHVVVAFGEG